MIAQAIVWYLSFAHFLRGGGGSKILKWDGAWETVKIKIDQSEIDKCVTDRHLEKFVRKSVTQKTLNQNLENKCAARTWLKN